MFSNLKKLLINFPSVEIREGQDYCEFWFPKKYFFRSLVESFTTHIPTGYPYELEDLDEYFRVTIRKTL